MMFDRVLAGVVISLLIFGGIQTGDWLGVGLIGFFAGGVGVVLATAETVGRWRK